MQNYMVGNHRVGLFFFPTPVTLGYSFFLYIYYSYIRDITENNASGSLEGESGLPPHHPF